MGKFQRLYAKLLSASKTTKKRKRIMEKINLGTKLKNLREEMGFTQEKLATILNISSQSISKWEKNESTPTVDTLVELSNIFNLSLDELLAGKTFKSRMYEANLRDIYNHSKRGFSIDTEIERFSYLVIPKTESKDLYWENMARNVFRGTLFAMLEDKKIELLDFNFETMKRIFKLGEEKGENNENIKAYFKDKSLKSRELVDSLLNTPFNTANCIISVMVEAINRN